MKATAKDLRYKTKEILDAIERGEEVLITYRGKERAKIVPVSEKRERTGEEGNSIFGIWHDNETVSDVNAYIDVIRGGRFVPR
ncbi:type II toxin-antitoxin system Phd/YefM family antitoxin [Thermodesulfobacteriota bacterium]